MREETSHSRGHRSAAHPVAYIHLPLEIRRLGWQQLGLRGRARGLEGGLPLGWEGKGAGGPVDQRRLQQSAQSRVALSSPLVLGASLHPSASHRGAFLPSQSLSPQVECRACAEGAGGGASEGIQPREPLAP